MIALANIISYLFNPVVLLVFVPLLLIYKTTNNVEYALMWTGYTTIFLLIMTGFIIYGVHKKIFTDLDVSKRTQRPLLFGVSLVVALFYLAGLIFLNGPQLLIIVVLGVIISVVVASFINTKLKMSIHVATVSALIFALAIIYHGYYYLTLILIPIVAWARVHIRRHTLTETIVGGIFGILLSSGMYYLIVHVLGY